MYEGGDFAIICAMRPRIYDEIVAKNLRDFRQMAFLSGPRQVGKTTVAKAHAQ